MRTVLKRVLLHIALGTIGRNGSDSRRLPIGTRNSSSDCDSFVFASSIETLLFFGGDQDGRAIISTTISKLKKKTKKYYQEDKDSNPSRNYKHCNDEACKRIAHVLYV